MEAKMWRGAESVSRLPGSWARLRYDSQANISNHSWPPASALPPPLLRSHDHLPVKSFSCQLPAVALESRSRSDAHPCHAPSEPFPVDTHFPQQLRDIISLIKQKVGS